MSDAHGDPRCRDFGEQSIVVAYETSEFAVEDFWQIRDRKAAGMQ
jgi:hypothetical protein